MGANRREGVAREEQREQRRLAPNLSCPHPSATSQPLRPTPILHADAPCLSAARPRSAAVPQATSCPRPHAHPPPPLALMPPPLHTHARESVCERERGGAGRPDGVLLVFCYLRCCATTWTLTSWPRRSNISISSSMNLHTRGSLLTFPPIAHACLPSRHTRFSPHRSPLACLPSRHIPKTLPLPTHHPPES
jgi:hypothetical protein